MSPSGFSACQPTFDANIQIGHPLTLPNIRVEQAFNQQLEKRPHGIAVIANDQTISFAELAHQANLITTALMQSNFPQGSNVGVLVNRSAQLPQCCLGIYQAGGVYVPLVADLPAQRMAYIIEQAQIKHIIALDQLTLPQSLAQTINIIRPENLNHNGLTTVSSTALNHSDGNETAAILFTSGSTGQPKGVILSHNAIAHMILGHVQAQQIDANDRILLSASPSYILGFREVHFGFFTGATHVAVNRKQLDQPQQVLDIIDRHQVTLALFTPSYLRLFNGKIPKSLKTIITAGERPNLDDAKHYGRHINYWNCHGATETCGTFSMYQVTGNEQDNLPSGIAFPNTQILLLDDQGQPAAQGQDGHIYIISGGLASGYLNKPQLSEQTFVQTPWGRAFNSKELGRFNHQGQLVALGRIDDAVKIDGQTIILSEIEQKLKQHPQVSHAIVLLVDKRLTAVIECNICPAPSQGFWRGFLAQQLATFMIPAHFVGVSQMPVNSSGKADRMEITQLANQDFTNRNQGTTAQTITEQILAKCWQQQLNIDTIYREDNFFTLGGTSLSAIQICAQLEKSGYQLLAHQLLATPILAQLANKLSQKSQQSRPMPVEHNLDHGIAYRAAEDFWTAWQLQNQQSALVINRVLEVKSEITSQEIADPNWHHAWQTLCLRHASLQTEFYQHQDDAEPSTLSWRIKDNPQFDFNISHVATIQAAKTRLERHFAEPMAMDQAPLAHAGIIYIEQKQRTLLWFVFHHAVIDGWSAQQLQKEFYQLICGHKLAAAAHGPAIATQQQIDYYQSAAYQQDKQFWRDSLNQVLQRQNGEAFSDYAIDKRRPLRPTNNPTTPFYQRLTPAQSQTLEQIARLCGIGLHGLLLTLLAHETQRRTSKSQVIIGTAFSHQPAIENTVIGMFVNVVPLLFNLSNQQNRQKSSAKQQLTLTQLFSLTQQRLGEFGEHARYPNSDISADFKQQHPDIRPLSANLYDISLTANPSRFNRDDNQPLSFEPIELDTLRHPAAGIDLAFHHEMLADGSLELGLLWNEDVYQRHTAQNWLQGFADWARYICQAPEVINQPLPRLLPREITQLQKWQNGTVRALSHSRLDQTFSQLTQQHPDHSAIISENQLITRRALENHANHIARLLLKQQIKPQDVVAVQAQCDQTLAAIVLAIFKVGAIYLPLAQDIPPQRQNFILKDANAKLLIVTDASAIDSKDINSHVEKVLQLSSQSDQIAPATPVCIQTPADSPAYIIYTSGTTGKPKGVLCCHHSLINCLEFIQQQIALDGKDKIALVSSPGFDASLMELGLGLCFGSTLIPISTALRDDPWAMKRYYQQQGVSIAFHAPSYIRISDDTPFESLRVLLVGGEAPNHQDLRAQPNKLRFFNLYGPSETTIVTSINEIAKNLPQHQPLAIGQTMANIRLTIRDNQGLAVAPGVQGEVWIGGLCLCAGYLNRPELNQKAFINTDEGKFYRSGDLGKWSADGQLIITGRIDHQVKLHGQRLELEEIETAITQLPEVDKAAVLVYQSAQNTKTLQAFVCLTPTEKSGTLNTLSTLNPLENENWRSVLAQQLPPYMIPANLMVVDALPVTPSGKLDRDALLTLAGQTQSSNKGLNQAAEPPKSGIESQVAEIWQAKLNIQSSPQSGTIINRNDNFFALGGNSLLAVTIARQLSQRLGKTIAARSLFAAPILKDFANLINEIETEKTITTDPTVNRTTNIATRGELEFWTAQQAKLDIRTFIILVQKPIRDNIDHNHFNRWQQAWAKLIRRHDGFRCYYQQSQSLLKRKFVAIDHLNDQFALQYHQVSNPEHMQRLIRQLQSQPLDMSQAPLWRGGIITETQTNTSTFWLAMHHAIFDGHSVGIMLNDLVAIIQGKALKPLQSNLNQAMSDYNAYLNSNDANQDRQYWQQLLKTVPLAAYDEWPLDFNRQDNQNEHQQATTAKVGTHRITAYLTPAQHQGLSQLIAKQNCSLHALMLTIVALEAQRRTGRNQFNLGTTASIRESAADDQIIGCFVNMLPIPYVLSDTVNFEQVLHHSQQQLMAALVHQRTPFAQIYHDVWQQQPSIRQPLRFPLFDIVVTENPPLTHQDPLFIGAPKPNSADTQYEFTPWPPGQDLALIHERQNDGRLMLEIHVDTEVYQRQTAQAWFDSIVGWAKWLAQNQAKTNEPRRSQQPLPDLLPQEQAWLKQHQHGPTISRPKLTVAQLFEQQVTQRPEAIAIITEDQQYNYQQLNQYANQIAHGLIAAGAKTGDTVAVLCQRSARLAAVMFGCFKANTIYLPLLADLPENRLLDMIDSSQCQWLIALDQRPVPKLVEQSVTTILRPEQLSEQVSSDNPLLPNQCPEAYILFTSGSTGRPKGTKISHKSLTNLTLSMTESAQVKENDRILGFSLPSFDASISEMGMSLCAGAALCPASTTLVDSPRQMLEFIEQNHISIIDITPSYLRLLASAPMPSVRLLITGGEAPFAEQVAEHSGKRQYFNAYGPTENTITSTMGLLDHHSRSALHSSSAHDSRSAFSCGKPLPNTLVEIRNSNGKLLPPGVTAEVWLGGDNLALDYINQPQQSAKVFVQTPQGRRYRSGDLGRINSDGELQLFGRIDEQVKLNGIRVEISEIEALIAEHSAVEQAVIVVSFNHNRSHRLAAFVTLNASVVIKQKPWLEDIQSHIDTHLPHYMRPSSINVVDNIPVNHSGKVDKKALIAQAQINSGDSEIKSKVENSNLPQDQLSQQIAKVWATHLGVTTIHLEDNFFALGGHSLLAIAVANDLEQQLNYNITARTLFVAPTLGDFAAAVKSIGLNAHNQSSLQSLPLNKYKNKKQKQNQYRATAGQQEFWQAQQAGHDTRGFNLLLSLVVSGDNIPSTQQWQQAWTKLVHSHDALRCGFNKKNTELLIKIADSNQEPLIISQAADLAEAQTLAKHYQTQAFDMTKGPLWRAGLITIDTHNNFFWLSLHHAIGDGWSLGIIKQQLQQLLHGESITASSTTMADLAQQQADYFASSAAQNDKQYWQQLLSQMLSAKVSNEQHPFDEWPLDMPRNQQQRKQQSQGSHSIRVTLDRTTTKGLRQLAQRNNATLHSVMLSLMALEINRRTARQAFMLGTVASQRHSQAQANGIGYYINMLPIPCHCQADNTIDEMIQTMQHTLAQSINHQHYPFAQICADFSQAHTIQRHPNRMPIFDFAVTENPALETQSAVQQSWQLTLATTPTPIGEIEQQLLPAGPAQDMVFIHQASANDTLELILFANANIYRANSAQNWLKSLSYWAQTLGQNQLVSSQPLPRLTPAESQWLAQCHGNTQQWPSNSFHQAFSHIAKQYPQQLALASEEKTISYGAMEDLTNRVAQQLISAGVKVGQPVAVLTERSVDLATIALAIFKAGGCYLPLSTSLPTQRLSYICQDTNPCLLIVLDNHAIPETIADLPHYRFNGETLIGEFESLSTITLPTVKPQQPAYIIYTSGSTGMPKGVLLSHQGWNNFAHGVADKLKLSPKDNVLSCASVSFDGWVSDLGMAWTRGATLVPVTDEQINDINCIKTLVKQFNISHGVFPPAYLRLFNHQGLEQLTTIMTVGEPPQAADVAFYSQKLNYFNGYGPTENSGATTVGQITSEQANARRHHSGTPLPNVAVYILDQQQNQLPPGSIGRIWTGGDSLGIGYLNHNEKTQQSFVNTPFGRLYDTGDLGRFNDNRQLEILGRADAQIKLRGQRVELGEIEAKLKHHSAVNQAVVAVQQDSNGSKTLWAFVVLDSHIQKPTQELSQQQWQQYLSQSLPSYMIPAAVLKVAQIPTNLAGKVDQAKLLQQVAALQQLNDDYQSVNRTPPANETEQHIAQVWQKQFPNSNIAREDDFFALGGDSLRVIAMINELRRDYHCSINQLYENPVLADFAASCQARPDHLLRCLNAAKVDWQQHAANLTEYDQEQQQTLATPLAEYHANNAAFEQLDLTDKYHYRDILLTGASGYLGAYLLHTLLTTTDANLTVIVRADNNQHAKQRLASVLNHYFEQPQLAEHPRLSIYCGDLRYPDLGLTPEVYQQLSEQLDAIYHSAANVNHFGHYHELYASNVTATANLIDLAASGGKAKGSADFHHISTISVSDQAPQSGFHLFSEYSPVPQQPASNYYTRTKQAAEKLVIAARQRLNNACIHRVGNVVFAAKRPVLQQGLSSNAFFRLLAAFIQIGKVPNDMHVWLCHVDYLAQAIVTISKPKALRNQTHHLEHHHRHRVADLLTNPQMGLEQLKACDFGEFVERLIDNHDNAQLASAHAQLVEAFGLMRATAPQINGRRLEVITERSQNILKQLGFNWPAVPLAGLKQLLSNAQAHSPASKTADATTQNLKSEASNNNKERNPTC